MKISTLNTLVSTLNSALVNLGGSAKAAYEVVPEWRGAMVQVNNITLVVYQDEQDDSWTVDVIDAEGCPDVYGFADVYEAVGFVVATYLRLI